MCDLREEKRDRLSPELGEVVGDGRHRAPQHVGEVDVIESDDLDIIRRTAQRADRQPDVRSDERGRRRRCSKHRRGRALRRVRVRRDDRLRPASQAVSAERRAKAGQPLAE